MALSKDASGVAGNGSVEPDLPSLVPSLGWLLGFRLGHSSFPSKFGHPCLRLKFSIGMGSGGLSHLGAVTMEKQQRVNTTQVAPGVSQATLHCFQSDHSGHLSV